MFGMKNNDADRRRERERQGACEHKNGYYEYDDREAPHRFRDEADVDIPTKEFYCPDCGYRGGRMCDV